MSHTSISGGYRFGFQAVRIYLASMKRRRCNEIFLQSKNFISNLGVIKIYKCLFRRIILHGGYNAKIIL